MRASTPKQAKKIIADLMDAARDCCLVDCQDDGENVDIVFSREHPNEMMKTEEAERLIDIAIKNAYRALTGKDFPEGFDPVEFLQ